MIKTENINVNVVRIQCEEKNYMRKLAILMAMSFPYPLIEICE